MKNKQKVLFILVLLSVSLSVKSSPIKSEPSVRIQIIQNKESLVVDFNGSWELINESSDKTINIDTKDSVFFSIKSKNIELICKTDFYNIISNHLVLKAKNSTSTLTIHDVSFGVGWWWEGKENRIYEGEIHLYKNQNNNFEVVVLLPLEQYLKGVVPYEIGADSPLEALKAQAVAARCEAVIALTSKLYSGKNHDLTSDVECQVFSGNNKRTKNSDSAVIQTKGTILTEQGKPINAFYASNCGGMPELISNVWPERANSKSYSVYSSDAKKRRKQNITTERKAKKWINSMPNVYCNPNNGIELPLFSQQNFRWKRIFNKIELSKMLANNNNYGKLLEIKPIKRGVSGRIIKANFIFEQKTLHICGELKIRQMWKPALRSSCFYIEETNEDFILYGAGWGHGVGMCQSGAVSQAKQGFSYKKILNHYYPKATISIIY